MKYKAIAVTLTVVLLQACGGQSHGTTGSSGTQSQFLKVGDRAPAFTAPTIDGKQVSLADYRGKTLLLLFSTTWCGSCKAETADVIRNYHALSSSKVAFLRIDVEEPLDTIRAFATEYGEPYTIALDSSGSIAKSGYDMPLAFPTTYVVDPNGIIRGTEFRPPQYADYIHAAEHGKSAVAVSPGVAAVLRQLDPSRFTFRSNEAAITHDVSTTQAIFSMAEAKASSPLDMHAIMSRERAIMSKEIVALRPFAESIAARKVLLNIEFERSEDSLTVETPPAVFMAIERENVKYGKALLALSPTDVDTEEQVVVSLSILKRYSEALKLAESYAKRYPNPTTFEAVAVVYKSSQNLAQEAVWQKKMLDLDQEQAASAPTDANLSSLESQAELLGALEAQLGNTRKAMRFYQYSLATGARIKHPSGFELLDIQDDEAGELALRLAGKTHGTAIFIEPWSGAPLPGSTANTIKYRLVIAAVPNTSVQLRAMHYASGWIPSFCSDNLCSPFSRLVTVPASGALMLELQMVPNDPSAPRVSPVTVVASGGGSAATTSLTTSYATHGGGSST
jgi:peroxiredoxin/tetratricopeptide (TPR) repeat protein